MMPLAKLFKEKFKKTPKGIQHLKADTSNRVIQRLAGENVSVIGVEASDTLGNALFVPLSKQFRKHGIRVPKVYATYSDNLTYLVEDLGDQTLMHQINETRLKSGAFSESSLAFYKTALDDLIQLQLHGLEDAPKKLLKSLPTFTAARVMEELYYFRYNFLNLTLLPYNAEQLTNEFEQIAAKTCVDDQVTFMHRDFQARNIMINPHDENRLYYIDYQSGRIGPQLYDVASLLMQGKARIPDDQKLELLRHYLKELSKHRKIAVKAWEKDYKIFTLLFCVRVLGTYGVHGLHLGKRYFTESIALALNNIAAILADKELPLKLPELRRVVNSMNHWWKEQSDVPEKSGELLLTIQSFAYPTGLPRDYSGHGGGFVFDVRAVPNPGRDPKFKNLTGKDKEVIAFLDSEDAAQKFYHSALQLVTQSAETYTARGFTSLSVAFGCTGGQHRSVYMAEKLARALQKKGKISIKLSHREFPNI